MRRSIPLLLGLLASAGCERNPHGSGEPAGATPPPSAPSAAPRSATAGGLRWTAADPLLPRAPENAMRAAEYVVREHPDAVLAVFYFGGGQGGDVRSNIDRWLGQLTQPDGRPTTEVARITRRTVNELPVTRVDATGTFVGRLGMGDTAPARPDWRVLGAIVEGPEGPVFFKMTGPVAGVEAAADAFETLVESVHP